MSRETTAQEPGEREPKVIPIREAFSVVIIAAGLGGVWWGVAELAGAWGLVILTGLTLILVGVVIGMTRNAPAPSVQPPTARMEVRPRRPEDGPAHNHS